MKGYYPEMGEQRPEDSQIEADLCHSGRRWYITTPLVLNGRGIQHTGTLSPEMLTPAGMRKNGWHCYIVTEKAMERLDSMYVVTNEMML
jgi:hypothetical protein